MISIISVNNLSFEFPNGHKVLNNISFSLGSNITALIGPNGIGKTTLIKLILDELSPTQGNIHKNISIGFLSQHLEPATHSVDEFLEFEYDWSLAKDKLLHGIDRSAPCSTLSGGEWMRVRLAKVLKNDFLILDEPTNNLDHEGKKILKDFLLEHHGGVLLISHDREILSLCESFLELSNKGLTKFTGTWDDYEVFKQKESHDLEKTLETTKLDRDKILKKSIQLIERQNQKNKQGTKKALKGGAPKILLGARKNKAQNTTSKIKKNTQDQIEHSIQNINQAFESIKFNPVMFADLKGTEIPSQKIVAEAKNFNIHHKQWIYSQDLNFIWKGNLRLSIKGKNGSGKSSLIKALVGANFKTRGRLNFTNLNVLYVDQNCSLLDQNKSIFENILEVSQLDETDIRGSLAKFLFMNESVFKNVLELSGGEKLRVALAKGFLSQKTPELIILDEPTNNLDLQNIEFLENLIKNFEGGVIIISHDEVFLNHCGIHQELCLD